MLISSPTLALIATGLHIVAVTFLSFSYSTTLIHPRNARSTITAIQVLTTVCGLLASLSTLGLPYLLDLEDPVVACLTRVVCFFYGCKVLDLTVAREQNPPVLLSAGQPEAIDSAYTRLRYIWLLLTETRYSAFDIAIQQKERVETSSSAWTFCPPIVISLMVYLVPTAETKTLMVMLVIQLGFDGLHAILHPVCPDYLFWRPFAASSLTSFWRVHWHAGAEPFLRSLAYSPGKHLALSLGLSPTAARAVGVIAAFNLSGIWHGWATAVLATQPWMVGLRVWSWFVSMGLGVLLENMIPKEQRGSLAQRVFVWTFFVSVSP
jgi:hypothetical protein